MAMIDHRPDVRMIIPAEMATVGRDKAASALGPVIREAVQKVATKTALLQIRGAEGAAASMEAETQAGAIARQQFANMRVMRDMNLQVSVLLISEWFQDCG